MDFYKFLAKENNDSFKSIIKNAMRVMSMFGSTYMCEQMFSQVKLNKSKNEIKLVMNIKMLV